MVNGETAADTTALAEAADTTDPSPADAEKQQTATLVEAEEQAAAEPAGATTEPATEQLTAASED